MNKKWESRIIRTMYRFGGCLPDEIYTRLIYRLKTGKRLNLKNPQTFNEKLQWLKLYDHNPLYTTLVDKYAVKQWVADKIGSEYVIPTLGVWDRPEDIDWDSLPDQFVLKTTHGGGGDGVVICKDKAKINKAEVLARLRKSMKTDPYKRLREWPYKNVPRRIIAEKFMQDYGRPDNKDLVDYKFYCFDGKPYYCQVIRDRHSNETIDFYNMEWNLMPFVGVNPNGRNGNTPVERPAGFDSMVKICERLSKDLSFSRIDLYEINDTEYFGEVTFFPGGAVGHFSPDEWNYRLGDLVKLEGTNGGGYKCLIQSDIVIDVTKPNASEGINDYKFFCFDGEVKYLFVATDRNKTGEEVKFDYFDADFNHLDLRQQHPMSGKEIQKPQTFEEMKRVASLLSKGFPEVRCDLYEINGKVYFGEMTFFHHGGVTPFHPESWDYEWGGCIKLPINN